MKPGHEGREGQARHHRLHPDERETRPGTGPERTGRASPSHQVQGQSQAQCSRPDTVQRYRLRPDPKKMPQMARTATDRRPPGSRATESWMAQQIDFSAGNHPEAVAAAHPAAPPRASSRCSSSCAAGCPLNAKDVLTNTEADVLGTGGEICFFLAISITPLITLTGQHWIAPLRRWYGIMFAVIGIADTITASITGDFAGGVIGRVAGHSFLARRTVHHPAGAAAAGHGQHPGAAGAGEVLEAAAADDVRHLGPGRPAPAAAGRVHAVRRPGRATATRSCTSASTRSSRSASR